MDEQRRLLAVAPPFRAVIYLLVLETGIRRKELNELKVGDFVFDNVAPFVLLPASITKNKKPAHMRLHPHVVAAVKSILPDRPLPSEWVFHNRVPRIPTIRRDLAKASISKTTAAESTCTPCASRSAPTSSTPAPTRAVSKS